MADRLKSLTIFFPFFNDAGTVQLAVRDAFRIGKKVANTVEVIAIHGGNSVDKTWHEIQKAKKRHPELVVLNHTKNQDGYAVIRHGFTAAKSEWIFYSDGDLQYDLDDLPRLVATQRKTQSDVVNGYKRERGDGSLRFIFGQLYERWASWLFNSPIRDVDCDFRLLRRKTLRKITLTSRSASILPELVFKLHRAGAVFAEVPVRHSKRRYGKSNYKVSSLVLEKLLGDLRLRWELLSD